MTYCDYERLVALAMTKCQRPSIFNQHKLLEKRQRSAMLIEHFIFSLWFMYSSVEVVTGAYIYCIESLVADFGRTFYLFLGVTFMARLHL